jgi:hypothetical protein
MIEELELRGMAAATKKSYLICCRLFVAHFMKSPEQCDQSHWRHDRLRGCDRCFGGCIQFRRKYGRRRYGRHHWKRA